ncbi:MAG: hypothetical protein HYV03_04885, partial [Deltaproteobacteria bacterium]|nr:hypothetical protein [Deltaproteobacteria bacterium]
MKRLLSLVVFCLVGSVVGLGIPGIDPALVLAIGVTLGPLSAWTCALCIGIIGLVTEAVMLQPIGSVVGPLLIVCGVGRWALVRLHLTMFIPLAAWSLGLGVIGLVVETIGVGRPRTDWLSLAGLAA